MIAAPPAFDPGLQPERTALSWTRTSLAIAANGLLVVGRDLLTDPVRWHPVTAIAGGAALLAALGVYLVGKRRTRLLARRPPRVPARTTIVLTGCLITVGCLALLTTAAWGSFR
ncbi:DUF202 domain-containing protein [Nocardia carnea]|uniref:DUF202 domain-containing protein n=1 Tax=Nocardia carnea TaxID=37328 RepID=A0ABW7U098_9NOCA|nr:DUF202 domain-containing protein [Nocardia carnea]